MFDRRRKQLVAILAVTAFVTALGAAQSIPAQAKN